MWPLEKCLWTRTSLAPVTNTNFQIFISSTWRSVITGHCSSEIFEKRFNISIACSPPVFNFYGKSVRKKLFVGYRPHLLLKVKLSIIRNERKWLHDRCTDFSDKTSYDTAFDMCSSLTATLLRSSCNQRTSITPHREEMHSPNCMHMSQISFHQWQYRNLSKKGVERQSSALTSKPVQSFEQISTLSCQR